MKFETVFGVMLGLVDRSDEVVIGTNERVVKARTVHRMPVGQRGDAAVMEPTDYKARRFYITREVELAKYGFSDDCEGCWGGAGGR